MSTSPPFVMATIPLASATGVVNVKAVQLPSGNVVAAHAFVDSTNTLLDPAKDATAQAATAAILAATAAFQTAE